MFYSRFTIDYDNVSTLGMAIEEISQKVCESCCDGIPTEDINRAAIHIEFDDECMKVTLMGE